VDNVTTVMVASLSPLMAIHKRIQHTLIWINNHTKISFTITLAQFHFICGKHTLGAQNETFKCLIGNSKDPFPKLQT